jgi:ABC-2 type transport system ATP-binding protein
MRILLQMARADAGSAKLLGLDAGDRMASLHIRRRTAFVPERKDLFPYMTVGDVIAFTRSFYPGWRGDLEKRYTRDFNLPCDKRLPQLSKGMLSKLHLLLALCRGAELILLDEPTDGLDPLGVEVVMKALVGAVAGEGATVLFSSHRLDEMEQMADYLCMIHHGRAMMNGSLDDLKAACRRVVMVFGGDSIPDVREFASMGPAARAGRTITVLAQGNAPAIAARAAQLGASSTDVETLSLREMFLALVKGDAQ